MSRIELALSKGARKALCVQVGETAGNELADLIQELAARVQRLERNKVDITLIAPAESANLLHVVGEEIN